VPTYAYACTACGHRFEVQQSFTDAALSDCPECAGRLRKLFNTVGIVFKGSGFYRTDSRSGASSGTESAAKDGATPAEKSSSEKSSPEKSAEKPAASTAAASGSSSSGSSSGSSSAAGGSKAPAA
jgi:putative FmdB family regulatory protein